MRATRSLCHHARRAAIHRYKTVRVPVNATRNKPSLDSCHVPNAARKCSAKAGRSTLGADHDEDNPSGRGRSPRTSARPRRQARTSLNGSNPDHYYSASDHGGYYDRNGTYHRFDRADDRDDRGGYAPSGYYYNEANDSTAATIVRLVPSLAQWLAA